MLLLIINPENHVCGIICAGIDAFVCSVKMLPLKLEVLLMTLLTPTSQYLQQLIR